jgi:DNA polymerase lambda
MAHLLSWSLFVWWTEQVVKDCTETLKKAEEVLRTGTMARIVSFRQDPRMTALRDLAQVWGIGLKQAAELYAAGFSTLQSLRTPEGQRRLNRVQKLGLKYHEDLTLRIPRDEITEMVALIRETAEGLVGPSKVDGLRVVGVGSYRRNKSTSGDIDVLVSHTDGTTHVKLLELLVESLTASGFLREKLTDTASTKKPDDEAADKNKHTHTKQPNGGKYMGICLYDPPASSAAAGGGLTGGGSAGASASAGRPRHRHIDIFTCPDDQWACALLTTTGSDVHNRSMRHWCAQMGLALSEKALAPAQREERGCYRDNKYINNKLFVGAHIPVMTERDIYDHLGLVYKEPHERGGKVEHKKLQDWDAGYIGYWLQCAVMLPEYKDSFQGNGIDGEALASITAHDLQELGVSEAHSPLLLRERDRAAAHDLNSWYRRFRRV